MVSEMLVLLVLGINKNVINKNHNELIMSGYEYRIHEIHEVGRSICEPEKHDQILMYPVSCENRSVRDMTRTNLDENIVKQTNANSHHQPCAA
jgi:hypothetical protein